jgi:hypothetical protein
MATVRQVLLLRAILADCPAATVGGAIAALAAEVVFPLVFNIDGPPLNNGFYALTGLIVGGVCGIVPGLFSDGHDAPTGSQLGKSKGLTPALELPSQARASRMRFIGV